MLPRAGAIAIPCIVCDVEQPLRMTLSRYGAGKDHFIANQRAEGRHAVDGYRSDAAAGGEALKGYEGRHRYDVLKGDVFAEGDKMRLAVDGAQVQVAVEDDETVEVFILTFRSGFHAQQAGD